MFHAEYVNSLVATLTELNAAGITYTFLNKYSSFIPTSRELTAIDSWHEHYATNEIADGRFTCDKIFWIDSDMSWTVADFMTLLSSDEDIISGLYALNLDGLVAASRLDDEGILRRLTNKDFFFETDPVVVGGVGFGFLCVKAEVWNSIPRPWFMIGKMRWPDDQDGQLRVNVGEDYSWCGRAQQAGYQIKVDPFVRVGHCKEQVLRP